MDNDRKAAILAISIIIPLTAAALWFSDQNKTEGNAQEQQLKVLVTFYPLYEFTKEVGRERIEPSIIIPSGIEPHDWEPTIQDIQKMQQADMIVINGAGFETWLDDFIANNPNAVIVDTSNGIDLMETYVIYENEERHDEFSKDPHIWLDPVLAKRQVENIAYALAKIDPENTQYYNQNANAYNTKLAALDNKIRTELSSCTKKDFIAFHDAFGYFAKEYGLNQHTIVGADPNAEPTAVVLQQIIENTQTLDLDIIFTEENVNPRISEVVADEIGGKTLVLSPIEVIGYNENYFTKMEKNLSNLMEELCS
jgi:zinc transport system substrate-binding protein